MFDTKNEPHEFVGESRAEVVEKACRFFDAAEADLTIRWFQAGEVYGAGGRTVMVSERSDRVPSAGGGEERRPRERERRDRSDRERGRGRGRGEREARGGRERGRDRDRDRGSDRSQSQPRGNRLEEGETARSTEPSVGAVTGELGEVGQFLLGVIERMGLGPFSIEEKEEGELVIFEVRGPATREIAEGDGRVVDALQLLTNQCAMHKSENPPRVVVDMEGESASRESFLSNLAHRVARRARDTGRPQRLDPMNAKDRRLIHVALRDVEDIATMSHGEGSYRQVVVVPEGADEYEEARASSR